MKLQDFPPEIRESILPQPGGKIIYRCLSCNEEFGIEKLLYTCPRCGQVLLLHDMEFDRLKQRTPKNGGIFWTTGKCPTSQPISGIYRYHEFIGPIVPLDCVVYLGEGHTPLVEAGQELQQRAGGRFFYKNDGQNPARLLRTGVWPVPCRTFIS